MLRAQRLPNLRVTLSIALPLSLTSFVPQNGQKICCQLLLESQRWSDWVLEAKTPAHCLSACKHLCAIQRTSVISFQILLKHPHFNEWGHQEKKRPDETFTEHLHPR